MGLGDAERVFRQVGQQGGSPSPPRCVEPGDQPTVEVGNASLDLARRPT